MWFFFYQSHSPSVSYKKWPSVSTMNCIGITIFCFWLSEYDIDTALVNRLLNVPKSPLVILVQLVLCHPLSSKPLHIRKCEKITLWPEIWWHDGMYHEGNRYLKWPRSANVHIFYLGRPTILLFRYAWLRIWGILIVAMRHSTFYLSL